ncbi:MAG: MarR family transcriptional regulator [Nonomuraea sp.]|nr:MarR family transcriptional regulator [Nonomuraea sp.]
MSSREKLVDRLHELMRLTSAQGLLIHQAIADRLGLIPTDLKCLDAARGEPSLTAGRLAEITGLSTSATTAALDRLERQGFIRRVRDERDRRRVFIESTGAQEEATARLFSPLARAAGQLLEEYDEEQLAFLVTFLERLTRMNRDLIGG